MLYVFGSINLDRVYALSRAPEPGETVGAERYSEGIGGKGANQAIAAARSGAKVAMIGAIGAIGADGEAARAALEAAGVDVSAISQRGDVTGHAVIVLEPSGENRIIVVGGANRLIEAEHIEASLSRAGPGDVLMLQNEVVGNVDAARIARGRGVRVVYSAAPFNIAAVTEILEYCDLLVMNASEAQALAGTGIDVPCARLVTRGASGAEWIGPDGTVEHAVSSPQVTAIDSTGAGDCFIGWFIAGEVAGLTRRAAMTRAAQAAALQVTRHGAAAAMPWAEEVSGFA